MKLKTVVLTAMAFGVSTLSAATRTWTGGGGTTLWNNAENWTDGSATGIPENGDLVIVGATSENDIEGLSVSALVLMGSDAVTVSGNQITLGEGGITNQVTADVVIGLPLVVSAAKTPFVLGQLSAAGNYVIESPLAATWKTTFNGVISGTGKIVKTGSSTTYLNAANTFSGGLDYSGTRYYNGKGVYTYSNYILYGPLHIATGTSLGSGAVSIQNHTGCWLILDNPMTVTCDSINFSSDANNRQQHIVFAGDTTFDCKKINNTGRMLLYPPANTTVTVKGELRGSGNSCDTYSIAPAAGAKLIVEGAFNLGGGGTYFHANLSVRDGGTLVLKKAGAAGYGYCQLSAATIQCDADITLEGRGAGGYSDGWKRFDFSWAADKSWLDLNGHAVKITANGCKNARYYIADSVTTATHGVKSAEKGLLMLGENLDANPTTVFNGVYTGKAGLAWNPPTKATPLEYILKKNVSDTQGDLFVSNGVVRITDGAGFSQLGKLYVSATGELIVEDSAANFTVEEVEIAEGGKITLAEGFTMKAAKITYKDAVQDYAAGMTVTKADWLAGSGSVAIKRPASPTESEATWLGEGETDSTGETANWSDANVDLLSGGLTALFASAGTSATIPAGRTLPLQGMVFNAVEDQTRFTLAGGDGASVYLGADGITDATVTEGYVNAITAPLLLTGGQTWSVANTLVISNAVSTESTTDPLVLAGNGKVEFAAESEFANAVQLTGKVKAYAEGESPLGTGAITVESGAQLVVNGATLENAVSAKAYNGIAAVAGTSNVFEKLVQNGVNNSITFSRLGTSSKPTVFHLKNGLSGKSTSCNVYLDGNTVIVEGKPLNAGDRLYFGDGTLDLRVAKNNLGCNPCIGVGNATLYTRVPYALHDEGGWPGGGALQNFSGYWDMCGCDQKLMEFRGCSGVVTSATEAVFFHNVNNYGNIHGHSDDKWIVSNAASFRGLAGLAVGRYGTNYTLTATSPTAGRLIINPAAATSWVKITGSWPNASKVIVSNGIWKIVKTKSVGRQTAVWADGGTINIAEGVTEKVGAFSVKGVEMPIGVYGGPDSDAPNKPTYTDGGSDYIFSGTGVMRVGKFGVFFNVH